MISTSAGFQTAIKSSSRKFISYVDLDGQEYYDDKIISWKFEDRISEGDEFRIGQTVANTFTITLKGVFDPQVDGLTITPLIGVELAGGGYEFIHLGTFVVEEHTINGDIITLECIDSMVKFNKPYVPTIGVPATLTNVLNDVCSQVGISFSGTAPNFTISSIPTGYTCREMVGFISATDGANATINRNNQLVFRRFTSTTTDVDLSVTGANYYENGLKRYNGWVYKIGKVTGISTESEGISYSNGTIPFPTMMELVFAVPWVSQPIVDHVASLLNGLEYVPFTMSWQGNPALESGDNLSIDEQNVGIFKTVALETTLEFDGGLTGTVSTQLEGSLRNKNGEYSALLPQRMLQDKIERSITETEQGLQLKVSYGDVISAINLSPETAKIQSPNIELVGAVTVLSDITGDLGTITAGDIDIDSDLRVGKNMVLGSTFDTDFSINFGANASITSTMGGGSGEGLLNYNAYQHRFNGSINFNNIPITGLNVTVNFG